MTQRPPKPPTENSGRAASLANLKPWRKGVSGNPAGLARTATLSRACRETLESLFPGDTEGRTYAQVIAERLGRDAAAGDIRAAVELGARAEGRPSQSVSLDVTASRWESLSSDALLLYATTGALPDGFIADEQAQTPLGLLTSGNPEDDNEGENDDGTF